MFWSELIPCLLFLGLLFFVPKSPRWLMLKGRSEEAIEILNNIHGEAIAALEINEIEESLQGGHEFPFRDLLKKSAYSSPIKYFNQTAYSLHNSICLRSYLNYKLIRLIVSTCTLKNSLPANFPATNSRDN